MSPQRSQVLDTLQNIVEEAQEEIRRITQEERHEREEKDLVQVVFPLSSRPYTYRCRGAKVGEWVAVVPPDQDAAKFVKVVALGRSPGFNGVVVKQAVRHPDADLVNHWMQRKSNW